MRTQRVPPSASTVSVLRNEPNSFSTAWCARFRASLEPSPMRAASKSRKAGGGSAEVPGVTPSARLSPALSAASPGSVVVESRLGRCCWRNRTSSAVAAVPNEPSSSASASGSGRKPGPRAARASRRSDAAWRSSAATAPGVMSSDRCISVPAASSSYTWKSCQRSLKRPGNPGTFGPRCSDMPTSPSVGRGGAAMARGSPPSVNRK
mmetsp:Transcript_113880/g.332747  ORF Transcript_113880/g.332747 Transcript_113880/m.332747 type:complete len:207 (-) Transcript_113880:37-657(-)